MLRVRECIPTLSPHEGAVLVESWRWTANGTRGKWRDSRERGRRDVLQHISDATYCACWDAVVSERVHPMRHRVLSEAPTHEGDHVCAMRHPAGIGGEACVGKRWHRELLHDRCELGIVADGNHEWTDRKSVV